VDGLNLRSAVAGVVLIVVLVLSAVFTGSGSGNYYDEFYAFDTSWITDNPRIEIVAEEQMLDSEGSVFSAIFEDQFLDGECHTAMALNSEPRTGWRANLNSSYSPDYIYGVTWGIPHDDNTIKKVIIHCDVSEDVTAPNWDECGTFYEIKVQYPLKSGFRADAINGTIRDIVSNLISTYLTDAKERAGCGFTELPDRSPIRRGFFEIDAFVTFANEGLFSAHFETSVHDPGSNTNNDYVETLNIDLSTGKRFSLADMLKPGEDSYRALQRAAIAEANYLQLKGLRDLWAPGAPSDIHAYEKDAYQPELLEEQEFVLNSDAIVLDCERYCGDGIAPSMLDRGIPLRIPFRQLRTFWNPEGPLRHIP